ncbi:hypothetical protein [Streptomyces mutabilis]|uniref:Uncharacterized protein n=1 Tax=Streptomyces mutabilis TaxID=67332 RepID=A0A086MQI3_9ACTN|nr:hypothetical protein [Streptomyces mutabilis]KFG71151.1 hypothetical protein FM21_36445 [Streptomyces mutabilis]
MSAARSAAGGGLAGRGHGGGRRVGEGVDRGEQVLRRGLQAHRVRGARQAQQGVRRTAQARLRDFRWPLQVGAGQDPVRVPEQTQRPHAAGALRGQARTSSTTGSCAAGSSPPAGGIMVLTGAP